VSGIAAACAVVAESNFIDNEVGKRWCTYRVAVVRGVDTTGDEALDRTAGKTERADIGALLNINTKRGASVTVEADIVDRHVSIDAGIDKNSCTRGGLDGHIADTNNVDRLVNRQVLDIGARPDNNRVTGTGRINGRLNARMASYVTRAVIRCGRYKQDIAINCGGRTARKVVRFHARLTACFRHIPGDNFGQAVFAGTGEIWALAILDSCR